MPPNSPKRVSRMRCSSPARSRAARIASIDASRAQAVPGVLLVMTYQNAPRLPNGGKPTRRRPPAAAVAAAGQRGPLQQRAGRGGGRRYARARHRRRAPVADALRERRGDGGLRAAKPQRARTGQTARSANGHATRRASTPACKAARSTWMRRTPRRSSITTRWSRTPRWRAGTARNSRSTTRRKVSAARRRPSPRRSASRPENVRVISSVRRRRLRLQGLGVVARRAVRRWRARQTGRPVRLVLERPQMFGPVGNRPRTEQHFTVAARRDGTLTAMRHDVHLEHVDVRGLDRNLVAWSRACCTRAQSGRPRTGS